MKTIILFIFLTLLISCETPCYECQSIGAEACQATIQNQQVLFKGKDCTGLKTMEDSNTDSLIKKVERLGFQCQKK